MGSLEGVTASLAAGIGGEIVVGHAPLVELECERLAVVAPDRYLLGRELARGGMGRILEAVDTRHDRPVAIKLGLTSSPQAVRRFVREALVTARLQHPAIVPVYEVGRWASGEPFYVMKRVEGRSLDAVIRAATGDRRSLLGHVVPVIEALAYAHAHGVIHRDLKPSNVLVGAYGEVMVIDWGLARVAGDAEGAAGLGEPTQTVGALGTPMYMSPEQARGETVGPAADVYALGVVLYFALSGRAPYDGVTGKAVLAQVLAGAPPAIDTVAPGLPPDLATIVKRAMARDPADRYPGAQALAEDLRRFMTGELVRAHSYSAWSLLARWARRNRTLVAVSAIALAAVAAVATASVARIARERDAAQAARLATAAHRDSAEKLVGGVLSQLVSRLERDGRLDLLAGTAALIDEYYAAVRASRLTGGAEADRRHAGALVLRGEAEVLRSDPDLARAAFTQAAAMLAGLEPIADEDTLRAATRAQLGLARLTGEEFERAVALADRLVAVAPDSPRAWALWGETHLAAIYVRPYRSSDVRPVRDRLAELTARFDDSRLGFVFALAELRCAEAAFVAGDGAGTDAALARAVTAHEEWTRRAPEETAGWEQLAWTYLLDARRARQLGRNDVSLRRAQAALAIQERLLRAEPDHVWRRRGVGSAQRVVCLSARRLGDLETARAACAAGLRISAPLLAREPDNGALVWGHSSGLGLSAEVELAAGRVDAASALIDDAMAVQGSRRDAIYGCANLLTRARVHRAAGRTERALADYREAAGCYQQLDLSSHESQVQLAEAQSESEELAR